MPRPHLPPLLLGWGLLLALLGCGPHGDCGCTPPPSGTVQGRLVDAQGQPLAGVEVCVVGQSDLGPAQRGLFVEGRGSSRVDGTFQVPATVGRHRILVRARLGHAVFLPTLGPEFELRAAGTLVAVQDLEVVPTVPAGLTVTITPPHGAQQEDALVLEQHLNQEGIDFSLMVASLKPAVTGGTETAAFPSQPPGTYVLSLWRSETTGTHPVAGTAKVSLVLAEGATLEQVLAVN